MCVALAALEAAVRVTGPNGERTIPFAEFHRLPGDTPRIDNTLEPDELITAIDLPAKGFSNILRVPETPRPGFLCLRAGIGCGALEMEGNTITDARIALGGVAHKPWRQPEAEAMLVGKPATERNFQAVADVTAGWRAGIWT